MNINVDGGIIITADLNAYSNLINSGTGIGVLELFHEVMLRAEKV